MKIKKGDKIIVTRGKDAGKEGEVMQVIKNDKGDRVIVKGVNIVKKSERPNPQLGIPGGIHEIEKPVDISNVMLLEGKKGIRVGYQVDKKSGKKVRISKKSGKAI